jgi:alpha-glucosidase (family GH31 glycosyl hydrolase)
MPPRPSFRIGAAAALLALASAPTSASAASFVVAPARLAAAPYAAWAHSHFVWAEGEPNSSAVEALVAGYAARNVTVGGVDVDSGWSTGYNNFVVSPAFGDLAAFTDAMHAREVNVILWATALVNVDSPNFAEGNASGFFLRDFSDATALVDWWHGRGAFLDYGNPDALRWWEAAMAGPLGAGVDGWKVDGIDPFVLEVLGVNSRVAGPVTLEMYQNWT